MSIARLIDDRLKRAVTRAWDDAARDVFVANLRRAHDQPTDNGAIREAVDQIDVQATGILTHVSMMIAALGITATAHISQTLIEQLVLYVSIIIYLALAIVCLRCLRPPALEQAVLDDHAYVRAMLDELIYERELNRRANTTSIALTLFIFVYLPISVVL